MARETVNSPRAPQAVGPYAHAVWAGDLLYTSGQVPIDPSTGKLVEDDISAQARQVFDNLEAVLQSAGLTMDHVIKCNVFLTTMADFPALNAVYQTRFQAPYPARSTVAVAGLPLNARVEIEMIARR